MTSTEPTNWPTAADWSAEVARLRQELDEARARNLELRDQLATVDVGRLAAEQELADTQAELDEARAERDRRRPVVEAAEAWADCARTERDQTRQAQLCGHDLNLLKAFDAYRATPDAEPAPPPEIGTVSAGTIHTIGVITSGAVRNREFSVPLEDDDRNALCVERWPECFVGGYDPRCCRFPKSCSCWKEPAGVPVDTEATP